MADPIPPLSARIADLLEMIATKVRELSVDRAAVAITWTAVALLLITAGVMAIFWLLVGIFRALGALMDDIETAYAVVGIILVIAGAVIWIRRYPQDRTPHEE
jgi:hypothetical protein